MKRAVFLLKISVAIVYTVLCGVFGAIIDRIIVNQKLDALYARISDSKKRP